MEPLCRLFKRTPLTRFWAKFACNPAILFLGYGINYR
jgi:hypothetical protein